MSQYLVGIGLREERDSNSNWWGSSLSGGGLDLATVELERQVSRADIG